MSIQDPPFGNQPDTGSTTAQASSAVREDLRSATDTAKSDLRTAAEIAKQDFAALKDQAADQIESLKSQAGSELNNLKEQAKGQVGEATERAKTLASERVSQLTDKARSFASEQKDLASHQISGVVDAVSRVADDLRGQNNAVAGYAQDIAGSLRRLADNVQTKSVDDLFHMAQDFGRRQPIAFAGIAALAGFAASRFLMASAQRSQASPRGAQSFQDDYRTGFEGGVGRDAFAGDDLTGTGIVTDDTTPIGMTNNGRL